MNKLKSTQKWLGVLLSITLAVSCGKEEDENTSQGANPSENGNTVSVSDGNGGASNVSLNVSCQNIPNVAKDFLGVTAYDDPYYYSIDIVMHPTPTQSGTYEVVKWDPQWGTSLPIDSNQVVIGLGGDNVSGYPRSAGGESMQISVNSDGSMEFTFDIIAVDYTGDQSETEISGTIKCD